MIFIAAEDRLTEQRLDISWLNALASVGHAAVIACRGEISHLTEYLVKLLLKLAHTALACVLLDYVFNRSRRKLQFAVLAKVKFLLFFGYEVAACYLFLLFREVAFYVDYLHAVE